MTAFVAAAGPRIGDLTRRWLPHGLGRVVPGPVRDGAVHVEGAVGLASAPLVAALDGDGAPISAEGCVLVGDVRLDARNDLVAQLRGTGRPVTVAASDAALVLHAYAAYGDGFLARLAGDFAFALWDGRRQQLLVARDQIGVMPLFWARARDAVLVSNAVDTLLAHPDVGDDLDVAAVADFLVVGYYSDRRATAFEAVRAVPPAHRLLIRSTDVDERRYWRLEPVAPLHRGPMDDVAAGLREVLDLAVADRLPDGPVAVQLSGGMDSTSIAASLRAVLEPRGRSGDLLAVCAHLGAGSGDREPEFAALVADHLGIPLALVDDSAARVLDPWEPGPRVTPEPTPYRATTFFDSYAGACAAHGPVAMTGIAGDAVLAYDPLYWLHWIARGRAVRVARAWADLWRSSHRRPAFGLRSTWRRSNRRWPTGPRAGATPIWLAPEIAPTWGGGESPPAGLRSTTAAIWPASFTLGHPTVGGLPVAFRHPLVDLRVLHFVAGLAPDPFLRDKAVLRASQRARLPEPVLTRRKTGLVPVARRGGDPASRQRLADFVARSARVARFVRIEEVTRALRAEELRPVDEMWLGRVVGLAHWLEHRLASSTVLR